MENRYETFTTLILNIYRRIQKIKNAEMESVGLKGKQVQVLFALYNLKGGANAKTLGNICTQDKGALSRTIGELEKLGLVFVDEDDGKKYKNLIKLTAKGKKAAKFVAEKIDGVLELSSDGVSEKERDKMYKSLAIISQNLNKLCEKYDEK